MLPLLLPLLLTASLPRGEEPVGFHRDVQPILSQNCFPCHGHDERAREAELRLDLPRVVGAEVGLIHPGQPLESEVFKRISTSDPDRRMPPPESNRELSADQIEILRRWIEQGADYPGHWSFEPIGAHTPPAGSEGAWGSNAIDDFVLAGLRVNGLDPSPEADRRTLIRRLYFDLTGMPPSPAEVTAFVADLRPEAYEELVDRLLAGAAYAERMTLAWMDAARYGDTSVHHADGPRDMWAWRDWAIAAYGSNMPFDQFTIEQLAGDLLPEPTRQQLIATGFHRNNATSDEGGAIDEELRVGYMVDRVKTTSNVWLGLSMECCQCHDHKFDPLSMDDYYSFYAFFNQSVEKGFQTRGGNAPPLLNVPGEPQIAREEELRVAIDTEDQALAGAQPPAAELASWIREQHQALAAQVEPQLGAWHELGPFKASSAKEAFQKEFGPESGVDLAAQVGGLAWTARPEREDGKVHVLRPPSNSALYLYRVITSPGATRRAADLGSDDTLQVWLNGKQVLSKEVYRAPAAGQERVELDLRQGPNELLLKISNGGGPAGYYFKLEGLPVPAPVLAALRKAPEEQGDDDGKLIRSHFVREVWPTGKQHVERLAKLRGELQSLEKATPTVMVMRDGDKPRMTYVLARGEYDHPLNEREVQPRPPEHILPMPAGTPPNRLGLAQWLVHPDHPLTARVAVNRHWALLFGRGLVQSVMDFGTQGERPSHPELLDWLASEFLASGWDVKANLKRIVMSATYRQSSATDARRRELDPENRLLSRAPRHRLQGEFLRDQALAVSGLLVDQVGGPGVKPYQPPGLWNEVSLNKGLRFSQDKGEKLYRKSMYIYWKRSAPMPAMATFDTPTRETCVVQRQRTNTPLQALVTLNDVQFVEAGRHLAARMLAAGETFQERLDHGFQLCTARPADDLRERSLGDLLQSQLEVYRADPQAALALLSFGESARDERLDPAEHAAWTTVACVLLNLDETLNRD